MRSFVIFTSHRILVGRTVLAEWGVWGTRHVWGRGEIYKYIVFWMGKPEGKKLHRRPESKWYDNIKMVLPEVG
jgi:hypothetical protein